MYFIKYGFDILYWGQLGKRNKIYQATNGPGSVSSDTPMKGIYVHQTRFGSNIRNGSVVSGLGLSSFVHSFNPM